MNPGLGELDQDLNFNHSDDSNEGRILTFLVSKLNSEVSPFECHTFSGLYLNIYDQKNPTLLTFTCEAWVKPKFWPTLCTDAVSVSSEI